MNTDLDGATATATARSERLGPRVSCQWCWLLVGFNRIRLDPLFDKQRQISQWQPIRTVQCSPGDDGSEPLP
jgi:hypothetical protein